MSNGLGQKQPQRSVFEFTKRRQWADLLITELSGTINFVLSPHGKVWYCAPAIHELLGWREEELVDKGLTEFIDADDKNNLIANLHQSARSQADLNFYARLKRKQRRFLDNNNATNCPATDARDTLFEFRGYPHFVPGQQGCQCYFLVATPFPSRNRAMLDTFLELKIQNERLEQRRLKLRMQLDSESVNNSSDVYPASMDSSTDIARPLSMPTHDSVGGIEPTFYSTPQINDLQHTSVAPRSPLAEPDSFDDITKTKKMKKSQVTEQFLCVTCGRTASPEWRKGPLGPKTLCNACGLRWKKQFRKG